MDSDAASPAVVLLRSLAAGLVAHGATDEPWALIPVLFRCGST
jgi:hypothetical protein